MKILGIESSCDETGIALYDKESGLLAHRVFSQIGIHVEFGGVVPELASRDHIRKTLPLITAVLEESQCQLKDIDGIAYTAGPGLIGALLTGASIGRSLAWALNIPCIGVHHMEGHLLAPLMEDPSIRFPFLALLVSGGHTQLIAARALGDYELLGESLDDAVGEAFDKTAKMLGLPYPGGPALAKLALKGNSSRFKFPRPMTDRPGLQFSYSGLKTFAINTLKSTEQTEQDKADIAVAFQTAAIDTLFIKCKRALKQTGYQQLVVAGGVSANEYLRIKLKELESDKNISCHYPGKDYCTDNGAMIAFAGCMRLLHEKQATLSFSVRPRWKIEELTPPDLN